MHEEGRTFVRSIRCVHDTEIYVAHRQLVSADACRKHCSHFGRRMICGKVKTS